MVWKQWLAGLAAVCLLAGGTPAFAQSEEPRDELGDNDPIEGVNRVIFEVNDVLDRFILRPIAIVYRNVVPDFAQDRIRNTLNNLDSPVIFANDLMQGEFDRAGATMSRFMINSTVGVAGLFDVADELGVPRHTEDFGQTLAVWGLGEGPYLYLPLLGPSNPRDLVGRIVDMGLDPLSYVDWEDEDLEWVPYTRYGLDVVDLRARNIEVLDNLRKTSVDYYAAIRSSYRQLRNDAIRNGEVDIEDLPAIE
ncbi:MAG: VacJ family lipoprotein [Alphaproteobacteria bacterium]|nr:VacJ family lipoprotein [Alphaproteobacteria bacterium]